MRVLVLDTAYSPIGIRLVWRHDGLVWIRQKKKKQQDDERLAEAVDSRTEDVAVEDSETTSRLRYLSARTEVGVDYEGRGETVGPWDVDDANAPDYDEYLSLGAYYLPFVQGIQLRIKAKQRHP